MIQHEYVERDTRRLTTEPLYHDRWVNWLYSSVRENAPFIFRALTGPRASSLLGYLNYDNALAIKLAGSRKFLARAAINWSECVEPPSSFKTMRQVFERQIKFWDCRPMPAAAHAVVCPADARVVVGSLTETSQFFIKDKFFQFDELLGVNRPAWRSTFAGGDFAIFRLTPEKYHYNHAPVSGEVVDIYEIDGACHACNPSVVLEMATPYSKNRRTVTVIDTDVPGGTGCGMVAMIEVVALMIGRVTQRYSEHHYDEPQPVTPGLFITRGQPKSLYQPGSSTDVLLFQSRRVRFADDLLANQRRSASSRYSLGLGQPWVETDVQVRSLLGWASQMCESKAAPVLCEQDVLQ